MKEIVPALTAKYDKQNPNELCGIITKRGKIIDAENTHEEPTKGFVIPAKLMLDNESKLYGTWHTHPNDIANLSQADYDGFKQWPDLHHFIIGLDGVRCFKIMDDLAVEVAL